MAKFVFFFVGFLVLATFLDEALAGGDCPLASKVASCDPRCIQDSDCSYGKKCCPNLCNSKSCSEGTNSGSSGSKGGSSGGTGTYCNNVKCSSGEKCVLDKNSKRMKCGRS